MDQDRDCDHQNDTRVDGL